MLEKVHTQGTHKYLCVTTNKIILARFFWPLKKVFADFGGGRNFQFLHDKQQKISGVVTL